MKVLWLGLMAIWLVALGYGAWGIWPHLGRAGLTGELIVTVAWLVIGAAAWLVALNFGIQRYWRR